MMHDDGRRSSSDASRVESIDRRTDDPTRAVAKTGRRSIRWTTTSTEGWANDFDFDFDLGEEKLKTHSRDSIDFDFDGFEDEVEARVGTWGRARRDRRRRRGRR